MTEPASFDVVVAGGGPAGAAAAAILAEAGHRIAVIEREKFPRYHIGESLLPFTFEPLRRLGLIERMRRSNFVKKYSVQFVSPLGNRSQPFYFNSRYPEDVAQTWQVLRSEFDLMLLENAREKGAVVFEETRVTRFIEEGDSVVGVEVVDREGRTRLVRAPITLDCTGRSSVAANQNQWRIRDPKLNKVAVWTYFRGADRDPGIDAGATSCAFLPDKGWIWYIPLHDDLVSVGAVAEGKYLSRDGVREPKSMFDREIAQNPWVAKHLEKASQVGEYFVTNEYSWHSRHCAKDGLVLVGDAFCFLDPIFSSGLMFALKSGIMAADITHAGLVAGDLSAASYESYGRSLRHGIENFRRLIYAFYDNRFSFRTLIDRFPEVGADVTDCLSGDIDRNFDRLFDAISELVEIPEPLRWGTPQLGESNAIENVTEPPESPQAFGASQD